MTITHDIAIIGSGAAGVMAALRGVLNNDQVLLFTGNAKSKKKARASWVYKVENMPGFHQYKKGIMDPNKSTLEWIRQSEFQDKLETLKDSVTSFKKENDIFHLEDSKGNTYKAKYVVLATGLMDVQPKINDSIAAIFPYSNTQLAEYCLRCDGHHTLNKETAIIGHSSSAAWVAVMLRERYDHPATFILTNGEEPDFSDEVKQLVELYDIQVRTSPIVDFIGNPKEHKLESVILENGCLVNVDIIYVSLGMIVYSDLAKTIGAELDERNFVKTNNKGETNIDNFYVIGDVRANTKKQIYTAWDTAVDSLDDINRKIRASKRALKLRSKNV